MRLTTKIIIGTFVGMLLILMALIYFFVQIKQKDPWDKLSGELVEMNVSGYNTIILEEKSKGLKIELSGNLNIQNETKNSKAGMLHYPKEFKGLMKSETRGDTLVVKLLKEVKPGESKTGINNVNFFLYVNSPVYVINDLDIKTQVKNLKADSLMLTAIHTINLDSCNIGYLEVGDSGWKPNLIIDNSRIEVLSLDLDNIAQWEMYKSTVECTNLTGTFDHISFSEKGCKQINWKPKEIKEITKTKE